MPSLLQMKNVIVVLAPKSSCTLQSLKHNSFKDPIPDFLPSPLLGMKQFCPSVNLKLVDVFYMIMTVFSVGKLWMSLNQT